MTNWSVTSGSRPVIEAGRLVGAAGAQVWQPSSQAYGTWNLELSRTGNLEFWPINQNRDPVMPRGQGYLLWWQNEDLCLTKSTGTTTEQLASIAISLDDAPLGSVVGIEVKRHLNGVFEVNATTQHATRSYSMTAEDNAYNSAGFLGVYWWNAQGASISDVHMRTEKIFQIGHNGTRYRMLHYVPRFGAIYRMSFDDLKVAISQTVCQVGGFRIVYQDNDDQWCALQSDEHFQTFILRLGSSQDWKFALMQDENASEAESSGSGSTWRLVGAAD